MAAAFPGVSCDDRPSFSFEGHWIGHRSIAAAPDANPAIVNSISKVEVQIEPNGRFTFSDHGLDYSGEVAQNSGDMVLTPDAVAGTSLNQEPESVRAKVPTIRLTPNQDGTLRETENNITNEVVVLRRIKP